MVHQQHSSSRHVHNLRQVPYNRPHQSASLPTSENHAYLDPGSIACSCISSLCATCRWPKDLRVPTIDRLLILASAEHELAKRANLFAASALCVSRRCTSPTERARHTDDAKGRLHILLHDQVWHLLFFFLTTTMTSSSSNTLRISPCTHLGFSSCSSYCG